MKQSCLTPTLPSERTTHFFQTRSERQQSSSDSNWRTPASARPAAAALIGRGAPSPSPPDWRTRGAAGAAAQAPAAAAFRPSQRWPACLRTRTGRGHKISSRHEDVAPERASCKPAKGKDCDLHTSPSACNSLMLLSILHDLTPASNSYSSHHSPPRCNVLVAAPHNFSPTCFYSLTHTQWLLLKAWAKVTSATPDALSILHFSLSPLIQLLAVCICLTFYSRL